MQTSSPPKTSPPARHATAAPAAKGALSASAASRPWRKALRAQRRWMAGTLDRDHLAANLRTLLWVIPLTVLIWVYAEREQEKTSKGEPLMVSVASRDPSRVVALAPGQETILVDVTGPRAGVQEVLQRLRGRGIQLDVDNALPPGSHTVITMPLVVRDPIFDEYGVSVLSCRPERLDVRIDELIERAARVRPPPGVDNLEPTTAFDPPTITIKGPRSILDRLPQDPEQPDQLVAHARLDGLEVLKRPGHRELTDVPVSLPGLAPADEAKLTVTPRTVRASLHVKETAVEGQIRSMAIRVAVSGKFLERFEVETEEALKNVRVRGPKDQVDALQRPDFFPQPFALLVLSDQDLTGPQRKRVQFLDLPKDVTVTDESQRLEVEFKITERARLEE